MKIILMCILSLTYRMLYQAFSTDFMRSKMTFIVAYSVDIEYTLWWQRQWWAYMWGLYRQVQWSQWPKSHLNSHRQLHGNNM